ncbi:MAG: hypothetical protein H6707_04015 [Deltaproteobacteria bacterium]|nr:hypothetical protein [Deltaproteobacteria bacterium]
MFLSAAIGAQERSRSAEVQVALRSIEYTRRFACGPVGRPAGCRRSIAKSLARLEVLSAEDKAQPEIAEGREWLLQKQAIAAGELKQQQLVKVAEEERRRLKREFERGIHLRAFVVLRAGKQAQYGEYLSTFGRPLNDREVGSLAAETQKLRAQILGPIAALAKKCPTYRAARADVNDFCDLAEQRDSYWNAFIGGSLAKAQRDDAGEWSRAVDLLERKGELLVSHYAILNNTGELVTRLAGNAEKIAEIVGLPALSANAAAQKLHARFVAALKKRAAISTWDDHAPHKDAAIAALLRRQAGQRGLHMRRYGVFKPSWRIKRDAANRPIERVKHATIMVKKDREPFCRIHDITVKQKHLGGGRYGRSSIYATGFGAFLVSRCQSF